MRCCFGYGYGRQSGDRRRWRRFERTVVLVGGSNVGLEGRDAALSQEDARTIRHVTVGADCAMHVLGSSRAPAIISSMFYVHVFPRQG